MDRGRLIPYIIIAVLGLLLYFSLTKEAEVIEIPVEIEVPVPVVEVQFDTVREPYPVYIEGKKEIDSLYFEKYTNLKDSVSKMELFKDAIEVRQYKETVEDDTIKIDISMRVIGFLKEYQVNYKTKPRTIKIDTTLSVAIPKKVKIFLGGELGLPLFNIMNLDNIPIFKANLLIKTKKDKIYSLSLDSSGRAWAGIYFKLN